jgi:hypothetical protein
MAQARGNVAQIQYPTFGGVSSEKAHLAFAWWVPAGGLDGQTDANLRHSTSVRAENSEDNRKCLADSVFNSWCRTEVGLQSADGSNLRLVIASEDESTAESIFRGRDGKYRLVRR